MKSGNNSGDASYNPDDDLRIHEGVVSDLTRRISSSERLVYIYTLTGIIVCTVFVTFCRSFFFFSVSSVFALHFFIFKFQLINFKINGSLQ